MSIEIITGVGESAHVSSTDQQAINQGHVGKDRYVYDVGNKLKSVITSNNLITIKDGVFCVGGIEGRIPTGSTCSVDIENGTSGVNRTDLICIEYNKSSGIESLSWEVVKGSSSSDPSYTTGDVLNGAVKIQFPMFRVKLTGLSITKVENLFSYAENTIGGKKTGTIIEMDTKVIQPTAAGTDFKLLTLAEINTLLGTSFTSEQLKTNVCVTAMNGDGAATSKVPVSTYQKNGAIYVKMNSQVSAGFRINYTVVAKVV